MSALPSLDRADRAVVGADTAGALYEQYGSRIFAFCLSRLGNREEAEDAAQTTFLNAFRSLNDGLVPRFELAWLFRIADNVCRDRRKSAWRRGRLEAARDLQELQDVVSAPERRSDGLVGLQAALAGMPERQRRAILLREWQGLSYEEIANELKLSKAAVETLIFRARRSLARGLEAPQEQPRRARAGFDVGWLLGLAKSLFGGGGAVKVAASVAAVAGAGLLVAAPLGDTHRQSPPSRSDVRAPAAHEEGTRVVPTGTGTASDSPASARREVAAQRSRTPARAAAPDARVPRATGSPSAPKGKNAAPTRPGSTPAPPAQGRPAPTGDSPGAAPGTAPSAPPAPPVSLPGLPVPELPPVLPEPPPVTPPAIPPAPDLPVDVPDVPDVPDLPGLP